MLLLVSVHSYKRPTDKCVYTIDFSCVVLSYLTILFLLARVGGREPKQAACRSSNFGEPVEERELADGEPVIFLVPITEQVIHHWPYMAAARDIELVLDCRSYEKPLSKECQSSDMRQRA